MVRPPTPPIGGRCFHEVDDGSRPDRSSEPLARAGDRPVPGYCLITRRGRGGFGEVWEAEAAGGFRVALKMVRLPTEARSAEVSALTVVRGIRHPNLLVSFGAWQEDGVLIVGMELADRSLWDRFIEAEDQGLRGIPRASSSVTSGTSPRGSTT